MTFSTFCKYSFLIIQDDKKILNEHIDNIIESIYSGDVIKEKELSKELNFMCFKIAKNDNGRCLLVTVNIDNTK